MGASPETFSMAVFCDFENIALGVREAGLENYDVALVAIGVGVLMIKYATQIARLVL